MESIKRRRRNLDEKEAVAALTLISFENDYIKVTFALSMTSIINVRSHLKNKGLAKGAKRCVNYVVQFYNKFYI